MAVYTIHDGWSLGADFFISVVAQNIFDLKTSKKRKTSFLFVCFDHNNSRNKVYSRPFKAKYWPDEKSEGKKKV